MGKARHTAGNGSKPADTQLAKRQDYAKAVNERLCRDLLAADSAEKAWNALLAIRGLEAAHKQLKSFADTGTIEREAANRRAAD